MKKCFNKDGLCGWNEYEEYECYCYSTSKIIMIKEIVDKALKNRTDVVGITTDEYKAILTKIKEIIEEE